MNTRAVWYEFSLSDGRLTFAKILLGPAKPVLRITLKGSADPFITPGWVRCDILQIFMREPCPYALSLLTGRGKQCKIKANSAVPAAEYEGEST